MMLNIRDACFAGLALLATAGFAAADLVPFDVQGNAGTGLLPGNENPPATTGGTGGEVGAGIFFDTDTNLLSINVGWGSGMGFTDLTGSVTAMHVHGPTSSAAPGSFSENAAVLITLHTQAGFNSSATNGGLVAIVPVAASNVADLMNGRLYINAHSAANPGGEIRGNLIAVPEPASFAAVALLGLGMLRRRR